MTIPYYANAIKVNIHISSPIMGTTLPKLTATLQHGAHDTAIAVILELSADPIASVITWLEARTISVTAVLYNNDTWYLATDYTGDLT